MKKPQTRLEFITTLNNELVSFGVADRHEIIADFELHFDDSLALGLSESDICEKLGDISEIAKQYGDDYISPAVAVPKTPEIPTVSVEAVLPQETAGVSPLVLDTFSEIEDLIANAPIHPEVPPIQLSHEQPAAQPEKTAEAVNDTSDAQNTQDSVSKQTRTYNQGMDFRMGGLVKVLIIDALLLSWIIPTVFAVFLALLSVPISLVATGITSILGGAIPSLPNFQSPFSHTSTIFFGIAVLALGGLASLLGIKLIKLFIKIIRGIINWHGTSIVGRKIFEKRESAK